MTDYYIVAVDEDGDVLACPASLRKRKGLHIEVFSATIDPNSFAFENQGDDGESKWKAASDALARLMPEDEEEN